MYNALKICRDTKNAIKIRKKIREKFRVNSISLLMRLLAVAL
jgi:hypothetical protein